MTSASFYWNHVAAAPLDHMTHSSWLCVSCCLVGSLTVCETKGRKGWHVQPRPINFITNCWRCSGIYRMRRHVSLVPCIPIPFSWSKVIDRMVLLNSNNGGSQLPKWRTTVLSGVDVTSYCLDHFKISLRAWLIIPWRSSIVEIVEAKEVSSANKRIMLNRFCVI